MLPHFSRIGSRSDSIAGAKWEIGPESYSHSAEDREEPSSSEFRASPTSLRSPCILSQAHHNKKEEGRIGKGTPLKRAEKGLVSVFS